MAAKFRKNYGSAMNYYGNTLRTGDYDPSEYDLSAIMT